MSASDEIWILGIHMTKFGKHFDKDVVDLGAEAIMGALADAGVSMGDVGILAAGNLMGSGGIGQRLQKQVGQTGTHRAWRLHWSWGRLCTLIGATATACVYSSAVVGSRW